MLTVWFSFFADLGRNVKLEYCPEWQTFVLVDVERNFLHSHVSLQISTDTVKVVDDLLRLFSFLIQQLFIFLQLLTLLQKPEYEQ